MAIPPNLNGFHHSSNDEFSNDARWDVQEVRDGEFQNYFHEQDGRLFHSHGSGVPYPLPVDTPEQERLNYLHFVVSHLLNQNFVGPVPEVLAPTPDRRRHVLDFCSGTGRWVMEMASEFTDVQFDGLDIVPIATRRPLNNVNFELHDINTPVRWHDNTVDFVHARDISMAVPDYSNLIGEAARVLRSGGLFLSGEWDPLPVFDNPVLRPDEHIPAIYELTNMVNHTLLQSHGMIPVAPPLVPSLLQQSGQFAGITSQVHSVPISSYPLMKFILGRYGESVKPMLKANYEEAHIDAVCAAYLQEVETVQGMSAVYRTVHARRV